MNFSLSVILWRAFKKNSDKHTLIIVSCFFLQAKPLPTFKPAGPKPQAKPACAVQCVIPMNWHPPNHLINGQPYQYQPTTHQPNIKDQGEQEFLPPATPKPPKEIQRPVAHPLQTVAEPPYR
jgi:hypothetical protein